MSNHERKKPGVTSANENEQEVLQTEAETGGESVAQEGNETEVNPKDERAIEIEKLNELITSYKYQLAEANNIKNRELKTAQDKVKFAISGVVEQFIEGLDLLFLASKTISKDMFEDNVHLKNFFVGFEMTKKKFLDIMSKNGVERLDPMGQEFNHDLHQAVSMMPSDAPNGTVINVLNAGYTLHGRVIRPAMVVVSSGKEE